MTDTKKLLSREQVIANLDNIQAGDYSIPRLTLLADHDALQRELLREAVVAMELYKKDYRTEGCAVERCTICARSRAAEEQFEATLAHIKEAQP